MAPTHNVSRETSALVLHNATAGGGRAAIQLAEIDKILRGHGLTTNIANAQSKEAMEAAARAALKNDCRLLIVVGGDGTIHSAANVIVESGKQADVCLGIIPTGGGNDFAAALRIPLEPLAAARALLHAQPRWVDLVRACTADGCIRLYLGGGGIGLDAEAARLANSSFRHWPGKSRYLASAVRALYRFQPIHVRVEFPTGDQPAIEAKVLLACVLNTPTYGAGLRLAPEANIQDGWLSLILVENLSFMQVLNVLLRLLRDVPLKSSQALSFRVQRVRLSTDRPCVFHGDGEILGPAPVDLEVVTRAIQVLAL